MSATIILGVIGSDAHAVGITILDQALSTAGFDVVNIGVQSSQQDFISAVEAHEGDAVLVSSLYGHAEQDCRGFHEAIESAGLDPITYIGGNLAVGQDDFEQTKACFRAMGFDRVFDSETKPMEAIAALKADMNITESEAERTRLTS
ncbi:glutamate mutase subunit S [Haladaptatus litoreus]|uniref:Glutamate mutase subunit S n=1 Tax=Haladaptatus litoreus TaxID=553468 RepID=A0A1N7E8U2_9EURY|nr:methylaspartate mutase subunit S [Haladaptatus litoreus]SIR84553.1 glutamate mutase subunit S [Haladaptatus litoreus]